jgi:hypothetical protein
MTVVIAIAAAAVALVLWNAAIMFRFENHYRYGETFQGNRYDCTVTFANSEAGMRCFVGAGEAGLYLPIHLGFRVSRFKHDMRIPWSDLV